jgi:hypothetical protein
MGSQVLVVAVVMLLIITMKFHIHSHFTSTCPPLPQAMQRMA